MVTAALIYGIRKGWEIGKVAGFAVWAGSENAARRNEVVARLKGRGGLPRVISWEDSGSMRNARLVEIAFS